MQSGTSIFGTMLQFYAFFIKKISKLIAIVFDLDVYWTISLRTKMLSLVANPMMTKSFLQILGWQIIQLFHLDHDFNLSLVWNSKYENPLGSQVWHYAYAHTWKSVAKSLSLRISFPSIGCCVCLLSVTYNGHTWKWTLLLCSADLWGIVIHSFYIKPLKKNIKKHAI